MGTLDHLLAAKQITLVIAAMQDCKSVQWIWTRKSLSLDLTGDRVHTVSSCEKLTSCCQCSNLFSVTIITFCHFLVSVVVITQQKFLDIDYPSFASSGDQRLNDNAGELNMAWLFWRALLFHDAKLRNLP